MNYLKLYEKLKAQGVGALPTETLEKISQRYLKNFDRKTEVILWAYLAYQMDSFHKKCAYPSDLGYGAHPCWCLFGNSTQANNTRSSLWNDWHIQLIFYQSSWGWRLRKGWKEKLDLLAQHYLEGVNSCPLPNIPAVTDAVLGGQGNQPGPYDAVLGGSQLRERQSPL